jgi:hypothetical protein
MAYNYVTVTWDFTDIAGTACSGMVTFTPSAPLALTTSGGNVPPKERQFLFSNGTGETSPPVLATDNTGISPSGWFYTVSVLIAGLQTYSFTTPLLYANGPTQTLASLEA